MIDFRYHIVSLISVFLALAVGIALGAGPLEETIGDTLTGQVEVLREEKDALRAELTDTQSSLDRQTVFLEDAAPLLLDGTLTDRRVAVVTIGAVEEDARLGVEERLVTAGATVSGRVQVNDAWTDPAVASFREELAGDLGDRLGADAGAGTDADTDAETDADADAEADPDADAAVGTATDRRLAAALVRALTTPAPDAPGRLADDAAAVLEALSAGDAELVTVPDAVTAPADAVVVLAADPEPEATAVAGGPTATAETDALAQEVGAHVAIVAAAQRAADGVLVAGGVATPGDLVSTILADGDLAAAVSTVTGFRGVTGQLSVALGLNAALGGEIGHYGFGDGLTPVPEPVRLPDADRADEAGDDEAAPEPASEG